MYTARKKIQKDKGVEPSEFEDSVAQVRAPGLLSSLTSRILFVVFPVSWSPNSTSLAGVL
jgi:hypothetical protein